MLGEIQQPVIGVVEAARAAFAFQHGLRIPGLAEQHAVLAQALHQRAGARIGEAVAVIAAKFGKQPPGPVFPIGNEIAGGRVEKHEDKQIALTVFTQPASKQMRRRAVPTAGVP